jgi:hypothetical protein
LSLFRALKLEIKDLKSKFDSVQSELLVLVEEQKKLHDLAVAETNQNKAAKSKLKNKNKVESNAATSNIESLSQNEDPETALNHIKTKKFVKKQNGDSDSDSIFDREEADENLLKTHMNRPEREKVKNLLDQMNAQKLEEENVLHHVEEIQKEINHKAENQNFNNYSGDFDREDHESESGEDENFVKPVKMDEIKPMVKIISQYCEDNGVNIMEVQDVIFSDDFSLTTKVSVSQLTKLLIAKFNFPSYNATLLARYMVEQPEKFKNGENGNSPSKYEFSEEAKLSNAKVISRLQSVMSVLS